MGLVAYCRLTGHSGPRGQYIQVLEPYLHSVIRIALTSVVVDESWYRRRYADIAEAIDEGRITSGRDHYIEVGYFENRWPREIRVDDVWYLQAYADVAEAIALGRFADPQEHYEKNGFEEGRLPYADWKL